MEQPVRCALVVYSVPSGFLAILPYALGTYYMKEKPCDDWAKAHNSVPYLGLMASEGRESAILPYALGTGTSRSIASCSRSCLVKVANGQLLVTFFP